MQSTWGICFGMPQLLALWSAELCCFHSDKQTVGLMAIIGQIVIGCDVLQVCHGGED